MGDSLITIQRARQLVERGCTTFLAHIVMTRDQPVSRPSGVPSGRDVTILAEAAESSTGGHTEIAVEMLSEDPTRIEASRKIPPFE